MKGSRKGQWIGIGLILGAVLGVLTDNIGLWLGIGIVMGAGMEARIDQEE